MTSSEEKGPGSDDAQRGHKNFVLPDPSLSSTTRGNAEALGQRLVSIRPRVSSFWQGREQSVVTLGLTYPSGNQSIFVCKQAWSKLQRRPWFWLDSGHAFSSRRWTLCPPNTNTVHLDHHLCLVTTTVKLLTLSKLHYRSTFVHMATQSKTDFSTPIKDAWVCSENGSYGRTECAQVVARELEGEGSKVVTT
jgi:hypothetical protein